MKKIFILLTTAFIVFSCEEKIDIKLKDQGEPKVVVDGFITTSPGPHYIRISRTVPFFSANKFDPVEGAFVTLIEDETTSEVLTEVAPGVYETSMQGKVDSYYELSVETSGETYVGNDILPLGATIDSLSYFFREEDQFNDEGYDIKLYAQEPAGEQFYRIVMYRNGKKLGGYDNFLVTDDKFVDGNYINGLEFEQTFEKGDTIIVQMLTITKKVFEFYRSLEYQKNSGGGFSPPPANLTSTISNEGFGYFGAFDSDTMSIVIE